jgi:hypothetical protein
MGLQAKDAAAADAHDLVDAVGELESAVFD